MEMHDVATMRHGHLQAVPQGSTFHFQQVEPMIVAEPLPSRPRDPSPDPGEISASAVQMCCWTSLPEVLGPADVREHAGPVLTRDKKKIQRSAPAPPPPPAEEEKVEKVEKIQTIVQRSAPAPPPPDPEPVRERIRERVVTVRTDICAMWQCKCRA
jgi:hypothetical protein